MKRSLHEALTAAARLRPAVDNLVQHLWRLQEAHAVLYAEAREAPGWVPASQIVEAQDDAAASSAYARAIYFQFAPMLAAYADLDRARDQLVPSA